MPIVSTDKNRIDIDKLCHFLLSESYWAKNRSKEQILLSIEHSICFSLIDKGEMIGFARVISDMGVFAYLADVYIEKEHRGNGFGKQLIEEILHYPDFRNVNRWMLGTMDAHELYRNYGFVEIVNPQRWMEYLPKGSEL